MQPTPPVQGLFKTKLIHKLENISHVRRDHELYRNFHTVGPSTLEAEQATESTPSLSGRVDVSYWYRYVHSFCCIFCWVLHARWCVSSCPLPS